MKDKQRKLIDLSKEVIRLLNEQSIEVKAKSLKAYIEQILSLQALNKPKK